MASLCFVIHQNLQIFLEDSLNTWYRSIISWFSRTASNQYEIDKTWEENLFLVLMWPHFLDVSPTYVFVCLCFINLLTNYGACLEYHHHILKTSAGGLMAQWLRVLTALSDDLNSIPSTHTGLLTATCNSSSWWSNVFWALWTSAHIMCIPIHPQSNTNQSLKKHVSWQRVTWSSLYDLSLTKTYVIFLHLGKF